MDVTNIFKRKKTIRLFVEAGGAVPHPNVYSNMMDPRPPKATVLKNFIFPTGLSRWDPSISTRSRSRSKRPGSTLYRCSGLTFINIPYATGSYKIYYYLYHLESHFYFIRSLCLFQYKDVSQNDVSQNYISLMALLKWPLSKHLSLNWLHSHVSNFWSH
jgi:hypothetical protein